MIEGRPDWALFKRVTSWVSRNVLCHDKVIRNRVIEKLITFNRILIMRVTSMD